MVYMMEEDDPRNPRCCTLLRSSLGTRAYLLKIPNPKTAHHNEQPSAQIALCTLQVKGQSLVKEMTLSH